MAQKVQVTLEDDIDGSEATETVSFGLDGTAYEIDLNELHAKQLRAAMAEYAEHARKVTLGKAGRGRPAARRTATGVDNAAVRAWAKAQGEEVKDRGRIPAELIVKFQAAGN